MLKQASHCTVLSNIMLSFSRSFFDERLSAVLTQLHIIHKLAFDQGGFLRLDNDGEEVLLVTSVAAVWLPVMIIVAASV
jgi:hypothetical protein